ncbi:MAG: hypothetical protein ACLFNS_10830, partial [Desulfobacterales bacterium]
MDAEHNESTAAEGGDRQPASDDGQNQGRLDRQASRMTEKAERRFFAREGVDPLTSAFARK